jgi:hypothetical protein
MKIMTKFILNKNVLYALLLAFMVSVMLPACSSSDEASQSDSGGESEDANMSCDENDSRDECLNDIL